MDILSRHARDQLYHTHIGKLLFRWNRGRLQLKNGVLLAVCVVIFVLFVLAFIFLNHVPLAWILLLILLLICLCIAIERMDID